jgi:DNA-binding NarL/FixJ family response regulator
VLHVLAVAGDPADIADIQRALEPDPLLVVRTATSREAALRLAEVDEPDVAVLDANFWAESEPDLMSGLRQRDPHIAIVVLTSGEIREDLAFQALQEGASGVLDKALAAKVLPRVVRSVAQGEAVVSRRLTMRLVERLRAVPQVGSGLRPVRSELSAREWEVLDLVAAGRSTREIAEELGLASETVRSHVKRVLRKLGAHSRAEAAERARRLVNDQVRNATAEDVPLVH